MNIKLVSAILLTVVLTGGAIAFKVTHPDTSSEVLHNADQVANTKVDGGLNLSGKVNLEAGVLDESDPMVDCTFPHSGTAAIKKSQCEAAVECEVEGQWKAVTITQCREYYKSIQPTPDPEATDEATPTPIEMKYTAPTMKARASTGSLIKDDCYREWESYFTMNPVNKPSFLSSMGLPGPCQ